MSEAKNGRPGGCLLVAAGLALVIGIANECPSGPRAEQAARRPDPPRHAAPSDGVYRTVVGWPACLTEGAYDEMARSMSRNDRDGMIALVTAGECTLFPDGLEARPLEPILAWTERIRVRVSHPGFRNGESVVLVTHPKAIGAK